MILVKYTGWFNSQIERQFPDMHSALYWISAIGKWEDYRQGLLKVHGG